VQKLCTCRCSVCATTYCGTGDCCDVTTKDVRKTIDCQLSGAFLLGEWLYVQRQRRYGAVFGAVLRLLPHRSVSCRQARTANDRSTIGAGERSCVLRLSGFRFRSPVLSISHKLQRKCEPQADQHQAGMALLYHRGYRLGQSRGPSLKVPHRQCCGPPRKSTPVKT
jgi:hypothetical protein